MNNAGAFRFVRRLRQVLKGAGEACPLVYNCRGWTQNQYVRTALKVIVSPFYIPRFFHYRDIPGREGLAFVLIAKNEAPYIEEWINFHHKHGVSNFIIYDNDSTDNFHEVLKPYIASGLVSYCRLSGENRQCDAYNMAFHDYGHRFKYMCCIDADEFMFIRNNADGGGCISNLYEFVDEFMKAHPNAGGLAVHWLMFGSNGHVKKPKGGVLENYTMRAADNFIANRLIKTVCDPAKVMSLHSAHFPLYCIGFNNLDENGKTVYGTYCDGFHSDKIRINHYFTKSKEEFIAKRTRNRSKGWIKLDAKDFENADFKDIEDTEILSCI